MLASKTDLVRPPPSAAKGGGNAEMATMTPSPKTKVAGTWNEHGFADG